MSTGNVGLDLLLNQIITNSTGDPSVSLERVKERYPSLSEREAKEICALIVDAATTVKVDKASLVVTAPPSFSIRAKSTKNTVQDMIGAAKSSILITGYSLSDYFSDIIDIIIDKSQMGVFVKFFVNNVKKQPYLDKLCRYKGRFLKVYNYHKVADSMSALHAKVISIDHDQTLITSANLSYHGQEGNIELGTLVESKTMAKQIDDLFTHLIFTKVFVEL